MTVETKAKSTLTLQEVMERVDGRLLTEKCNLDTSITHVASSDLMSDVLAFSKPHALLLTGLVNLHVVHAAEMADLAAVIFVRGKRPSPDVIQLAEENGLPLITSRYSMFEISGRLYEAGLIGCDVQRNG
jgi:predicted transcriptional regulator